jgi:hypothetical protein
MEKILKNSDSARSRIHFFRSSTQSGVRPTAGKFGWRRFSTSFLAIMLAAVPASAWAATRYVAPTGNDLGGGTLGDPYRTTQRCASVSTTGDVCSIRAGTYREQVTPNSGVTFEPYNGEAVSVRGDDPVTGWVPYGGNIYRAALLRWPT